MAGRLASLPWLPRWVPEALRAALTGVLALLGLSGVVAAGSIAALSFMSLAVFPIQTIRNFGIFAGLGIFSVALVELTFTPSENADADKAPAYRIHLGDEYGPEVGAGWKHSGERAGPFVSVLLDDPVFQQPIRARLFQSDEDGRDWGLHWTRQKKRDEQE